MVRKFSQITFNLDELNKFTKESFGSIKKRVSLFYVRKEFSLFYDKEVTGENGKFAFTSTNFLGEISKIPV